MMVQIDEIVKANLCVGCGACISESQGSLKMELNEQGFYVPKRIFELETDSVKVCPFNPTPEKVVEDADKLASLFLTTSTKFDTNLGGYNDVYVGFSNKFRKTSSSGGIGTYLMEQLLKSGIVDRLFVVAEIDGSYNYRWIESGDQVMEASKTRYYPVTLERLFNEIDNSDGKVAVSGVPSFLKAIRLKQYYHPELKDKIKFLIGIICGGWKSTNYTDYLAQKAGIEGKYNKQEYRIKDETSPALDYSFGAFDDVNVFHQIKMKTIGDTWGTSLFNANAYDFEDDVTAELADISLGDAWLNPFKQDGRGTSVVITRSVLAEDIISKGIKNGDLNLDLLPLEEFIKSQAGGIRHKQKALKFRLGIQKEKYNLVPPMRERLKENIPFEFKLVQKQRMVMREKSLEIWNDTKDAQIFDQRMIKYCKRLKIYSKCYHLIQKLKKRYGIRHL